MHTTKNVLRNHLEPVLAEKIIQMFFRYANSKNDAKTQVREVGNPKSDNLSEERRIVKFYNTKETLTVIFECVVQENSVKHPINSGVPSFFHQCVTDINFQSEDKAIVNKMQRRFEEYFDRTNEEIPPNISGCIFFNGRERSEIRH